MKKIISMVIFAAIMLALTSCGGNKAEKDSLAFGFTDSCAKPIFSKTMTELNLYQIDKNIQKNVGVNGEKEFELDKDNATYKKYNKLYTREYNVYSDGKLIGKYDGKIGFGEGYTIDVEFDKKISTNHYIAVANDANIYTHPVTVTKNFDNTALIKQMSDELKKSVSVIKNVSADIDNDGTEENIITVTDNSDITASALIDNGKIISYLSIFSMAGIDKENNQGIFRTDLNIEIADVDANGTMEIYCVYNGYEWTAGKVYLYQNNKLSYTDKPDETVPYKNYNQIAPPGFKYE